MAHLKRPGQFVERYHGWIAAAAFKAAEILLAEAGARRDLLLSEALFLAQTGDVPPHQLPHVHAAVDEDLHILSLSTLICIAPTCQRQVPILTPREAGMDRLELIKNLIALRFVRVREAEGAPRHQIEKEVKTLISQEVATLAKAMSTPEGSIASMVETYLALVGATIGPAFDIENPPQDEAFKAANKRAITQIEALRSSNFGSEGTLSDRFCDFVHYRIRLETRKEFGRDARDMGLDSRTVAEMVSISVEHFASKYLDSRAFRSSGSDANCHGPLADATESGKQWAIAASGKIAIPAIGVAALGLATGQGMDGKLTALAAALVLYVVVVGPAFAFGFFTGTAANSPSADGEAGETASLSISQPLAGPSPDSLASGFGRKQVGSISLRSDARPDPPTAPGSRFKSLTDDQIAFVALFVIVAVAYVGESAWDSANGNLISLPYFVLLELSEALHRAISGIGSLFGLD